MNPTRHASIAENNGASSGRHSISSWEPELHRYRSVEEKGVIKMRWTISELVMKLMLLIPHYRSCASRRSRVYRDINSSKNGVQLSLMTKYLPSTIRTKSNFSRKSIMLRVDLPGRLKICSTSSTDILGFIAIRVMISSIGCGMFPPQRFLDNGNYALCSSSHLSSGKIFRSANSYSPQCSMR